MHLISEPSALVARLAGPLLHIRHSGSPRQRTCGQGEARTCALSQRGHCVGGASTRNLGLSCGIIICDTALGALNGFGLFSQLGPDQRHGNQQRRHSLIIRRFRARAAVRSLGCHGPREDVTRQVGASSCREGPSYSFSPGDRRVPLRLCPVWLPPRAGRARMIGWRSPHEAQGGQRPFWIVLGGLSFAE